MGKVAGTIRTLMVEHFFICPYCWSEISMLLDPSVEEQQYVEDCENCCNPIAIELKFSNHSLTEFSSKKLEA